MKGKRREKERKKRREPKPVFGVALTVYFVRIFYGILSSTHTLASIYCLGSACVSLDGQSSLIEKYCLLEQTCDIWKL